MSDRLIRVTDVMNITSLSRTQIYRLMAEGDFPKQTRLSHRVSCWSERAVQEWINEKLGLLV